jgi:hypothetical protein
MKYIFIFLAICLTFAAKTQVLTTHYFNDTINGKFNQIHSYIEVSDGIIISGEMNINSKEHPVIIKISPAGELIWSTINSTMIGGINENCRMFDIELFDDGYIYGSTNVNGGIIANRIWKVNAQDGTVVYAKKFYSNYNIDISLEEFDSTKFIATYLRNSGGSNYAMFAFLDKSTGDTLSTKDMGLLTEQYSGACVDENKNIYYWKDNKFMKFNKGDLSNKIWERSYQTGITNKLDIIYKVYLDQEDRIFVFGHDGGTFGHGNGNLLEVSSSDGKRKWDVRVAGGDVLLSDFIDRNGKLYICYKHSLVGSSYTRYFTGRVDKTSGILDWYSYPSMTAVGTPVPSQSSSMQAPLSLDIDCSGGLYMTGYYGDANYGPEMWGVMKLDANSGVKLYDFTVTEDSTNFDDFSVGKVLCVFGNSPVVLGHLENLNSPNFRLSDAYYIAFDPQNGAILDRHGLSGQFQIQSKTIDIINNNDIMYVYKQQGKYIVVQAMDVNQNIIWSKTISDTMVIQGGQMQITSNYLYITAHINNNTPWYPFDNGNAYRYYIYRINKQTGSIINTIYYPLSSGTVIPMEIETEDNQFFFYYRRNINEYVRRWSTSTGLGSEILVNLAGSTDIFEGEHNNVLNYDSNFLIVIGSDAIRKVSKSNLTNTTTLYTFNDSRNYFDFELYQEKLFLVGKNNFEQKLITVYDIIGDSIIFERTYGSGILFKVDKDAYNNFVVGGERDSIVSAIMIKRIDGMPIWESYIDSIMYPKLHLLDCKVNPLSNTINLTGSNLNNNGSSDVIFTSMNYYGDTLFTYFGEDVQLNRSSGFTIEEASDSLIWLGGAHNRLLTVKEGFISKISSNYCTRIISTDSINCSVSNNTLFAWPGNSFQWYLNGSAIPGATSQSFSPTSLGFYNVLVEDVCGLDSLVYGFEYNVVGLPIVFISQGGIFCNDETIQLHTNNLGSYVWYYNGGVIPNENSNSIYVTTEGNYNVMVTNSIGCSDSSAIGASISYYPTTQISFIISLDSICENSQPILFNAFPSGGTFSGTAVNNNQFDPTLSSLGVFYPLYSYIDNYGCVSSSIDTISVFGSTSSSLNIDTLDFYILNGQTYTSSGNYTQVLLNEMGCDSTIHLNLNLEYSGIFEQNNSISIYPNPSRGLYNIELLTIPDEPIYVIDEYGRIIKSQKINDEKSILDLQNNPAGFYFLNISGKFFKIVKEN